MIRLSYSWKECQSRHYIKKLPGNFFQVEGIHDGTDTVRDIIYRNSGVS